MATARVLWLLAMAAFAAARCPEGMSPITDADGTAGESALNAQEVGWEQ